MLVFAFVGMRSQEIAIDGRNRIDVALQTDIQGVDEIVVVGYGVTKKSLVTGSIAKINSEEIAQSRSTRIEGALQGKTVGFWYSKLLEHLVLNKTSLYVVLIR